VRSPRLRVRLVPSSPGEHLKVSTLAEFLKSLQGCLHACELAIRHRKFASYRLVELGAGSISMAVAAIPRRRDATEEDCFATIGLFCETAAGLESGGQIRNGFGADDLGKFRKLFALTARELREIVLDDARITAHALANVDRLLGRRVNMVGSLRGRLDAVNIHSGYTFYIYPRVGNRVECEFREEMLPKVVEWLGRNVTVRGRLSYRGDAVNPKRVLVEDIEVHPETSELPHLLDYRGALKDVMRGTSSERLLSELRDEE